jgi:hypothetical protein
MKTLGMTKSKIVTFFAIIFIVLINFSSPALAEVIFEDNFDNRPDWSSSTITGVAETWPATMQTVIGGPTTIDSPPAWYSYRSSSLSHTLEDPLYVIDSNNPYGGSGKSLRYNLENQSYMNGGGLDLVLCNSGDCGWDTLYLSFFMKLEEEFDFEDGGSQFLKLARMYSGNDVQTDDRAPSSTYATSGDYDNNIKRSMNTYLDIVEDGYNDYKLKLIYYKGRINGVDYIANEFTCPTDTFNFKDHLGEWLYIQFKSTMNTIGNADGSISVWAIPVSQIDSYDINTPTFSVDHQEIRTDINRHFNTIIFTDNMSGQWERDVPEQTIYFDNLVVSSTPVGPFYNSAVNQIRADVDNNSTINTTDAMLTLRNSLGLNMSNTNWFSSATTGDVNCDGTFNSTDAMLILRHSLGLDMTGTGWCE